MRNARILARMVASTLAAAVWSLAWRPPQAHANDSGWKVDTGAKHAASFSADTGW